MGLEGSLGKQNRENVNEADEPFDPQRRHFIQGIAAAAGSLAVPSLARADEALPEELKELNLKRIQAYQGRLLGGRSVLEDPHASLEDVLPIIEPGCSFDIDSLRGTQYDHDAWFRNGCTEHSWPAVQLRSSRTRKQPILRWAHEPNTEDGSSSFLANSFCANEDLFLSGRHALEFRFDCEVAPDYLDLAACSIYEEGLQPNEVAKDAIRRSSLRIDRRMRNIDIHSEIIHMPSIHEERGSESDNTDVTTSAAIKITPTILESLKLNGKKLRIYNPAFPENSEYIDGNARLLNSYMCVVPTRDAVPDGISGSPVLLDSLCGEDGLNVAAGCVWGVVEIIDHTTKKVIFTLCFLHGPKELIAMADQAYTIISEFISEEKAPNKAYLTRAVQQTLKNKGYSNVVVDGAYGPSTTALVEDFQRRQFTPHEFESRVIPGVVDRLTFARLFPKAAHLGKKQLYALHG